MSKNSGRSNNGNSGGGFPVFAGMMVGIVLGLAIAGGIAWFVLKKNPVPAPQIKEPPAAAQPAAAPEKPQQAKPATPAKPTAANAGDGKARFEFYKELTDKSDNAAKKAEHRPAEAGKAKTDSAVYFLQEGAYSNADDADKVKAKLALLGMTANVQPANIPDKGVWYRVRLGPYKNSADMNEALATLKLNGLNASPIRTP